jgi:hypothetical protein
MPFVIWLHINIFKSLNTRYSSSYSNQANPSLIQECQTKVTMKPILPILLCWILTSGNVIGQNARPIISNLNLDPNWVSSTLTISYDVSDAEMDPLEISLFISDDAGNSFQLTDLVTASGDIGYPVSPGTNKQISVDINGLSGLAGPAFTVRVVADDLFTVDIQSLVDQVDSNLMRSNLEFLQGIRHRITGLTHLLESRQFIEDQLLASQLVPGSQSFLYSSNYNGVNVFGTSAGTASQQYVVIDAHYDSVNDAPGADDNGSGVVGVLEAARILGSYPSKKGMRYIGFDLEEEGLVGSIRYATKAVNDMDSVAGVFNFEMIGYYSDEPNSQTLPAGFSFLFPDAYNQVANNQFKGDFISNVGNAASSGLADAFEAAAAMYVPDLKVISLAVPGNGAVAPDLRRSDHAPFWDAGYQALMLTDGANFRNECYHTPEDTLDNKLSFTFMSNVVKATIAAAAELAELQHGSSVHADFQAFVSVDNPDPCTLKAWGNPAEPQTIVLAFGTCTAHPVDLQLYSMNGQLLMEKNMEALPDSRFEWRPGHYNPGVYLLRVRNENKSSVFKIMLY